ncbi:MAG: hypothetical protein C0507_24465, partial [Cyanobacteria bacterium PR.3.49]|nr:hypothetical protein [Cyanobacteria bacterium PR.3.49]
MKALEWEADGALLRMLKGFNEFFEIAWSMIGSRFAQGPLSGETVGNGQLCGWGGGVAEGRGGGRHHLRSRFR